MSSVEGLFERNTSDFNYDGTLFPFKQVALGEEHFFVSEINLVKLFDPYQIGKLLRENNFPISSELVEEIKAQFLKGYTDGLQNFEKEIGSFFFSLAIYDRLKVLVDFMDYCHRQLYFEGFTIPEVLYSLGYIQACLLQAYKTYQNLSKLATEPLSAEQQVASEKILPQGLPAVQKIELKYPVDEIAKLWLVLIDIHQCGSLTIPPAFRTEKDIENLLGEMFTTNQDGAFPLPDRPHYFYELPPDYQPILSLLMHATYKLNHTFTRLKLPPYSALLKQTFSAFKGIENVQDITGNITKKKDMGIVLLRELPNSKYAKNALKILAKIKDYRLTL